MMKGGQEGKMIGGEWPTGNERENVRELLHGLKA